VDAALNRALALLFASMTFAEIRLRSGHGRAEASRWGKRGAGVNTIRSGIIIAPLAKDELSHPAAKAAGA